MNTQSNTQMPPESPEENAGAPSMGKRRWPRTLMGILFILTCVFAAVYYHFDKERSELDPEIRAAYPGQYTELSDGITHYELAGSENGEVVVLVHGLSVPYYVWDPTFHFLADAGFRVLRYDQYGRGLSDRPGVTYDMRLFVRQLFELLQAVEVRGPVHFAGLSLGGPIAAAYAAKFPRAVRSLTLISPQVKPDSEKDIQPLQYSVLGEFLMAAYVVPMMMPRKVTQALHSPDWFPEWEDQFREQTRFKGFRRAMLSTIRNLVGMDPRRFYKVVAEKRIPCQVIWGKEEKIIAESDALLLPKLIPGLETHMIHEAGHLPHYERPETVNPVLAGFVRRSEASPRK